MITDKSNIEVKEQTKEGRGARKPKRKDKADAEQIMAYFADGDLGSTLKTSQAILLMALLAHVHLSPSMAATLYLASLQVVTDYYAAKNRTDISFFEVDGIISICAARLPVADELERFKKVQKRREKEGRHNGETTS
jgi:hypothetical protein